jgi:hypothetical protein
MLPPEIGQVLAILLAGLSAALQRALRVLEEGATRPGGSPPTSLSEPQDTRNYQRPSLARRGAFGGEGLSAKPTGGTAGKTRWTSASNLSWGDVLALAGEGPDAIREGVRVALAKCEAIFRLQEPDGETAPRFDFGGEAII